MRTTGLSRLAGFAIIAALAAFLLLPLVVLLGTSVSETEYLAFPPEGLTLHWFHEVLTDPEWMNAIWISTQIAAAATTLAALVAVPAALGLTRSRIRWRGTVEALLTLPMLVPQIVLGVGLLQWLLVLGVGRTLPGFVLAHTMLAMPFVLRSVLAALVAIPDTCERAAADLGAPPWRRFWRITLPLIRPGLGAGCLFGFGISYINVEVSMFLATPESTPLPVMLLNHVAYTVDAPVSAVSTLTVLVAFVALLILDRVTGLERVGATP
jgi:putative spermidine/putrescine transport system permease protein